MELTCKQMPVHYLDRSQLEPIYQEQTAEIVLPEQLPDIDRILNASGVLVVQEQHWEDGELRLSGGLQCTVLYQPEQTHTPACMEAWLPFSVRKHVERSGGCMIVRGWIKSLDARMVNARKAIARANLGFLATLFTPEELLLCVPEDLPENVELLQNDYPVLLPVACGQQEFRIQDELTLPQTSPAVEQILKWTLEPEITERRMIGSKAVFQGHVAVQLLYLGADNSLNTYVGRLPFSQYAELEGEWPDAQIAVFPVITGAQLETDGQLESRTLLADLNLLAQVCVIDRVTLPLTEDAYAIGATLTPQWQEIAVHPQLDTQRLNAQTELNLPVLAESIVELTVYPDRPTLRRREDAVTATAQLSGNVLYTDREGRLQSKSLRGECACTLPVNERCCVEADCALSARPDTSLHPDSVQIAVPMAFTLEIAQQDAWKNLCGGTLDPMEAERHPSVIVRHWSGGPLWPLAKELGARVADIEAVNELGHNNQSNQNLLLIPIA